MKGTIMTDLNPSRNLAAHPRVDCLLTLTEPLPGKKPVLALLMRLLWAAAFVLPAFGAQASVVFTNLYSFTGTNDGGYPYAGLVQGSDGNFYGTTAGGGTNGLGTVFQISTNGALTSLYSFTGGHDGANPQAGLVQASDGYFYGTTSGGGTNSIGTVFKISTNGVLTSLYSFTGTNDGANPRAALVQGSDGNFYGTTFGGGTNGYGTVFKINTNGALTSLYSFTGGNDGWNPPAGLVQGSDGNFYGTTRNGGTNNWGTVFKISTNGALTSLYSFTGGHDGANPQAGLVQGSDGSFYGTTFGGGTNGYGTVFKINTNGALTSLYSFAGVHDGASPQAGLVQGSDGDFYGTTYTGATNNYGTVFQVTTKGGFGTLVFFNSTNGASPAAALTLGSDGNLYGTTSYGGSDGLGTVFRLSPLAPLIVSQPQPASLVVLAGVNVTINAGVLGALPLSYQWTLNTTNLPGATNATLTLNNVSPAESGNYALLVTNNLGIASSSNAVLTVLPALVITLPVSGISATGAVLNGSVALGPDETLAWFEWGADTNYGFIAGITDIPGGSGTVTLSNALGGLEGDLIYHYRVVGWNNFGIVYGTDQAFEVGLKPTAVTLGATGITTNSVTLHANVNAEGRYTTVWFKWGTTINYGNLTPATSVGSGSAPLNFSNVIVGLSWNTNYHCQVVASNSLGQVAGGDVTFVFGAPLAVTEPATLVTGTNAWINGLVTPNLFATTAWFEWGTNTSYGTTIPLGGVGGGGSASSVSNLLNGLDATVTYHYRLAASNGVGIAFGADAQISTSLYGYAQSVLADQPLVYYHFDEASGATALNSGSLGTAANGTYNATVSLGNPSLVPAFGYAAGFNNTNSGVAVPALGSYSQLTIEAWAKPHSFGVGGPGNPHSVYNSIYTDDIWTTGALHTHIINNGLPFHEYEFAINGNNPIQFDVGNSGLFPSNSWVHLAATYDSAARILITYVNGHPLTTNIFSVAMPVNLAAAHIGAWIGPNSTPNWFDGGIDEFAIYGTVLPANRIQAHYQAAIGNPVLLAVQTTNKLALSWIGPGFKLQRNPNLSNPAGWTNVVGSSNSPVRVTISNSGNQFFRLSWP
jgi:uncharacterized repeat protein (TIGR03803 family)